MLRALSEVPTGLSKRNRRRWLRGEQRRQRREDRRRWTAATELASLVRDLGNAEGEVRVTGRHCAIWTTVSVILLATSLAAFTRGHTIALLLAVTWYFPFATAIASFDDWRAARADVRRLRALIAGRR